MKVLVVVISVMVLIGSSLACGQSDSRAADHATYDQVMPRLPSGLSIDKVKERLGEPQAQDEVEGGEVVLTYGLWQLVFHPSLYKRTRHYLAGYWPADRPVAPLDRQVRALELGSSRRIVERELGRPEAWQILTFSRNERLWYGNGRWKLVFLDGDFRAKQRFG